MFHFKQFSINDSNTAMKVGTDSVMFGAWSDPKDAENILDIGTGSGLLALMMAQKTKNARITAIEIDAEACKDAESNFYNSKWNERLKLICNSFQNFAKAPTQHFDFIISNPPYFIQSLRPPKMQRSIARHNDSLHYIELFYNISLILKPLGRVAFIIPFDQGNRWKNEAANYQLYVYKETIVRSFPHSTPHRLMLEFVLGDTIAKQETEELYIYESVKKYSQMYQTLCSDFYL